MATQTGANTGSGNSLLPDGHGITWTNVDLSSASSGGIHLGPIAQEMLRTSVLDMGLKCHNSRLQPHLQGANELKFV